MKQVIAFLIIVCSSSVILGQEKNKRSNTNIDTYYYGEKHFSIKDASTIYYNEGNSELTMLVDFANLKSGVDSLDEWLLDLSDSKFLFRGYLPSSNLLTLTHHNAKSMKISGIIEFNGRTHHQSMLISLYEISKGGILFRNTGADYCDRVSANIQLTFLPKHFGVDQKPHHLKKKISIAVGRGIINKV